MPAEFEPHAATWIAWPHHAPDWPGKLPAIDFVYVEITRALARSERVCILVPDPRIRGRARRLLKKAAVPAARVVFFTVSTNRSWTRDFGPLFVKRIRPEVPRPEVSRPEVSREAWADPEKARADPEKARADCGHDVAITDWKFNAWAKYSNWRKDDAVNAWLAPRLGMQRFTPEADGRRVVLEGGSIDVNGRGSLLTTEECLLSRKQARNPGLPRERMEAILAEYLGATNVLWLGRGIAGDDTHGHVDDIARFTDPRTIVAAEEPDRRDANHAPLADNLRRLSRMRDEAGRPFRIVTLPMPGPIVYERERLPASYLNFYVANAGVLVPTFNDPRDRIALDTLARLFPTREVVGIHAVDLVWGLGTIHCLTQQQPA